MSNITKIIRRRIDVRKIGLISFQKFLAELKKVYGGRVEAPLDGEYALLTICTSHHMATDYWLLETADAYSIPIVG